LAAASTKLTDLAAKRHPFRPLELGRRFIGEIRKRLGRRTGLKVLRMIERHSGQLPVAIKRQCDDYARDVFGDKGHAPWLYAYAASQRTFKEGWIPCSYYNEVVVPEAYTAGDLCHHRHLTRRILQTDHVPDVGYMLGGKLFDINFHRVEPTAAAATLFRDHPELVFKRNRSSRGRGIVKLTRQELRDVQLDRLPDGVFQTLVHPHPAFESLLPERGPTIRFTTVLGPNGKAELRAAHLRVATLKSQFVAPGSGINISINLHSGCLVEHGYIASTLQKVKHHPDTGFVFSGHPMPNFAAAADHVLRLHDSFPVSKIIGWDVCIDLYGQLQLFEWNLWWPAIRFLETTSGPHFRGLGWENLWRQPRD
jgi:hypothetical protein